MGRHLPNMTHDATLNPHEIEIAIWYLSVETFAENTHTMEYFYRLTMHSLDEIEIIV